MTPSCSLGSETSFADVPGVAERAVTMKTLGDAARGLRDRWLEQVNSGQFLPPAHAKYDVSRFIGDAVVGQVDSQRLPSRPAYRLPAAD